MKTMNRGRNRVGGLLLGGAAVGAALATFFADPVRGKQRREEALSRLRAALKVGAERTEEWRMLITRPATSRPQMTELSTGQADVATSAKERMLGDANEPHS